MGPAAIWVATTAALLWLAILSSLARSYVGAGIGHGGDTGTLNYALNGLFTGVGILILWIMLAVLLIIVGAKRALPWLLISP